MTGLAAMNYAIQLIRVIDGDTIECWIDLGFDVRIKRRVRYLGVDAWETRTKDQEVKAKGVLAKARNLELLKMGKVFIEPDGREKYGRVLARVFVQTKEERLNICDILLREGHANPYNGGRRGNERKCLNPGDVD